MQTPITIPDVQVSFPEFRRIQQQHLLRKLWWIVVLVLAYPLYVIWAGEKGNFSTLTGKLIGTLLFAGLMVGAVLYGAKSALQRNFESAPFFRYPTTFQLDDTGIHASNATVNSQLNWSVLHSARQFGPWYVITDKNNQGYLLDSRRIQAPATEADLRALLQGHGIALQ